MTKTFKDFTFIVLFVLISTFAVWLPHILALPNFWNLNFSNGFNTIYRNYDGLEYVIIAKTFYNSQAIARLPQALPDQYFASHFPGYSILIATFAPILGFLKSMLFVSVASTIASAIMFYILVKDFKLTSQPLFLTLLFLVLPARWLVVHSIGSSEPTFFFFVIASIYFFMKFELLKKYYLLIISAFLALGAQITRPPGILFFIALSLYMLLKIVRERVQSTSIIRIIGAYLPMLLVPLGLFLIFFWFSLTYQNFWAYFNSGDNIHLTFPPFQVFNKGQYWVGDIWLEDIIYIFILGFLGGAMLWRKKFYLMAFFVLIYLVASIFIAHRDISRYILPVTPFILIAFEKVLTSREFKIILPIVSVAVYLYAQNFILQNSAPIPNPFLFN